MEKSCTCYRWQLTGIPCHHAYTTIMESRGNPEEFVHEYYNNATYAKAYAPIIKPIPGPSDWDLTNTLNLIHHHKRSYLADHQGRREDLNLVRRRKTQRSKNWELKRLGRRFVRKPNALCAWKLVTTKRIAKLLHQHQGLNQKKKGEGLWRITFLLKKTRAKMLKNQTST